MSGPPLFQYQQKAEPVVVTPPVAPDAVWEVSFPDQIDRLTVRAADIPTGPSGAMLEGHNFPPEANSWEARYPSILPRPALRTSAQQALALWPFPLPNDQGPPFKPRKEALGVERASRMYTTQYATGAVTPLLPVPGITSFFPLRPAANPRAASTFATWSMATGAFVYQIPLPEQVPVRFPDTVLQPALQTSDHQFFAGPWMSGIEPPETAWIPIFPEFIARHTIPTTAHPAFMQGPFTPILPIPALAWHPVFADQVWTTTLPVAAMQTFAFDVEPILNPAAPDLSWHPVYPDAIDPLERLRAALQQTWAANYVPIAPPPVPELSWGPQGPTWIRDVARERSVELLTRVTFRSDIPPQSVSWQPTFADRVSRTAQVTPAAWFSSPPEIALASVAWVPNYPDRLPPVTLPAETQTTFDIGFFIAIAVAGAWRPYFPIPAYATWVLAAVTSASDIPPLQGPWPCVHLRIDDQTSTRLLSLAVTSTGLLETEQTATALINLDVC